MYTTDELQRRYDRALTRIIVCTTTIGLLFFSILGEMAISAWIPDSMNKGGIVVLFPVIMFLSTGVVICCWYLIRDYQITTRALRQSQSMASPVIEVKAEVCPIVTLEEQTSTALIVVEES